MQAVIILYSLALLVICCLFFSGHDQNPILPPSTSSMDFDVTAVPLQTPGKTSNLFSNHSAVLPSKRSTRLLGMLTIHYYHKSRARCRVFIAIKMNMGCIYLFSIFISSTTYILPCVLYIN